MTILIALALGLHVLFGICGVVCYYALWMHLGKSKLNIPRLKKFSIFGSLGFIFSMLTGGYYYVQYYSAVIKPIIGNSFYPWAHAVFMDAKEHIFLLLLYQSLLISLAIFVFSKDLESNPQIRRIMVWLTGQLVILGMFVAISGMFISGAIR